MANGNGDKKGEKPKYRLSGHSRDGSRDGRWTPCGAAWVAYSQRTGEEYISIRMNAIPVDFDGTLALHEIGENAEE